MSKATNPARRTFIPMQGRWQFKGNAATYKGTDERGAPDGLCLWPNRFRSGIAEFRVTIGGPDNAIQSRSADHVSDDAAARFVIGYNATTENYCTIGLGGYGAAFVVTQFIPGQGWRPLQTRGVASQLRPGHPYELRVEVTGQHVALVVDGVRVIETALPVPLTGDQAGLFTWGKAEVRFEDFSLQDSQPQIFVVMQFGEPYDSLYQEVIQPVSARIGYKALRADDLSRPGVILQDIRRGIIESDVVVAEITPVNANVFYELGYAHALEKPTILLASRKTEKLPFYISGYRVVFYDDTIGGKREIETNLQKYLESIRRGQTGAYANAA